MQDEHTNRTVERLNEYQSKRDEWRRPENYLKSKIIDKEGGTIKTNVLPEEKGRKFNVEMLFPFLLVGFLLLLGGLILSQYVRTFLLKVLK